MYVEEEAQFLQSTFYFPAKNQEIVISASGTLIVSTNMLSGPLKYLWLLFPQLVTSFALANWINNIGLL